MNRKLELYLLHKEEVNNETFFFANKLCTNFYANCDGRTGVAMKAFMERKW